MSTISGVVGSSIQNSMLMNYSYTCASVSGRYSVKLLSRIGEEASMTATACWSIPVRYRKSESCIHARESHILTDALISLRAPCSMHAECFKMTGVDERGVRLTLPEGACA